MCFFSQKKKEQIALYEVECNSLIEELGLAIGEANAFLANSGVLEVSFANEWIQKYSYLSYKADIGVIRKYKKCKNFSELEKNVYVYNKIPNTIRDKITEHNDKIAVEVECNELCEKIAAALKEKDSLFLNRDVYLDVTLSDDWINKYSDLKRIVLLADFTKYEKCSNGSFLGSIASNFLKFANNNVFLKNQIVAHNNDLARRQIAEGYRIIGDVEGRRLDEQQMFAIVKPSKNHLIVAGAGTGKTTTIIGKIKYILKKAFYYPEEILVLSFTNASASEMSERIHHETQYPIAASTFHKLGLEIIKSVEGKVPKIYSDGTSSFVREYMRTKIKDDAYLRKLCDYALYYRGSERSESDFKNKQEYNDYLISNVPTTLNGEVVKSYGELDIANFLYQNQIIYEYEPSYKFDTNNEEYGQYHPDFYLPDYDLYIEYFGINREGEVADYFNSRHGKSATEEYIDGIKWKRKLHEEKKTTMVECYAYEKFEDTLLTNLEIKLYGNKVELKPLSTESLWKKITEENKGISEGLTELFGTVISLMKSNNYSFESFEEMVSNHSDARNNLYLLSLIRPIYDDYDNMLKSNNEIDFDDMINRASKYIREGKYINPYKFVIIDEYQDISKSRYNLLKELRDSSFYELFCVGDDWQSIYRFTGSDINYIIDFEKYWGTSEVGKIETTYRFTKSLIEISSGFIMENPRQIKKTIRGSSSDSRFSLGKIVGYRDKNAFQFMVEQIEELPKGASVFFIGRYNFDKDLLKNLTDFEVIYDNINKEFRVKYFKRPDLYMKFMTAHKSKGLQADYVFIINNKDSKLGFPSKIQDSSLIDMLLEKGDFYPFAEERRLFYVALTRAKIKVFLIALKEKESIFARELFDKYEEQLKNDFFTCPECGGRLIKKKGQYGDFFGCSNYAKTGCRYTRKCNAKST